MTNSADSKCNSSTIDRGGSVPRTRYRPREFRRVEGGAACLANPSVRLVECQPELANFLSRREQFDTLEEIARDFLGFPNLNNLARRLGLGAKSLSPSLIKSWVLRMVKLTDRSFVRSLSANSNARQILSQLDEMVRNGLLVSEGSLIDLCGRNSNKPRSQKLSCIGVPTRDRPDSLHECVTTYLNNSRQFGHKIDLVVADDSDAPDMRDRNRQLLSRIGRNYESELHYAGLEEKSTFANELINAGLQPDTVRFALFGPGGTFATYGANRNALLLGTLGALVLCVDDDTRCVPVEHPNRSTILSMTESNSEDIWIGEFRQNRFWQTSGTGVDILEIHDAMLGRNVREIIQRYKSSSDITFEVICSHLLKSIESGDGRVLTTRNGSYGHAGTYSSLGLLAVTEYENRKRIMRSKKTYECALQGGEILRVVKAPTISHRSRIMTTFVGLDNTDFLPPFMPVGRNEDGIFSTVITKCFQNSYCGQIPWALFHAGTEAKTLPCSLIESAGHLRLCDIITSCIDFWTHSVTRTGNSERLGELGSLLQSVAAQKTRDFVEFLRHQLGQQVDEEILRWQQLIHLYHASPAFWAADVRTWIDGRIQAARRADFMIPRELGSAGSLDEMTVRVQDLVGQFGRLLTEWPNIVDAVNELRNNGRRLPVPV